MPFQNMRHQQGDIFFPVPERRNLKADDADPEVEIHSESSGPSLLPEVPVCGKNKAGLDTSHDRISNRTELALVDDSQKLSLEKQR